jgi:hypothetical protein
MNGSSVGQFEMAKWRPSNDFLMSAVGMWLGWVKQEIHADDIGHLKISTVFAGNRTRNLNIVAHYLNQLYCAPCPSSVIKCICEDDGSAVIHWQNRKQTG